MIYIGERLTPLQENLYKLYGSEPKKPVDNAGRGIMNGDSSILRQQVHEKYKAAEEAQRERARTNSNPKI